MIFAQARIARITAPAWWVVMVGIDVGPVEGPLKG
jgi:hypothetical protein